MARKSPEGTKDSSARKGRSASAVGALLAAVLAVAVFYAGAQYFTAKRSISLDAIATAFDKESITLYRVPSGALDKFAPEDSYSSTIKVPMAPTFSVRDAQGKAVKPDSFYVAEGAERAVSVTINPQGKVCRIRELGGFFSVEGPVLIKGEREMDIDGRTYSVGGTLFLAYGSLTGSSGDQLEGYVETGDTVKALGYADQALVVDVSERGGRLAVSASVEGARVYVDGILRGKAPLVVPAAPGTREVMVRSDGYRDHRGTVQVASMQETKYSAELEKVTGTLNVTSSPSGADVFVANELKGQTPLKVAVPPGRHEVRFEMEGYYPKTSEVIVTADYEQPVSATLVRMAGSAGSPSGGSSGTAAREVTVVSSSPSTMTFEGMYPAGYVDTFRVTSNTTVDGWAATKSTLERLLPGEKVSVTLAPDGSVASMSKTYSHGFTLKDQVQAKSGAAMYLGSRWVECALAWDAVVQDADGNRYMREIRPGDTVTVYGASAGDIRFVKVEETLGETSQVEGHLVSTPQGLKLFGDSYIIGVMIPQDLKVADISRKATVPVSQVPSGSRVRFRISPKQTTVWAELVWRANVSVTGPVSVLYGTTLRVAAYWDDFTMGLDTVIYDGVSRSSFYSLNVGDTVLAAGPSEGDIRFIHIQDKTLHSKVIEAVLTGVPGRQQKAFYEITSGGLGTYPYYVPAQTTLGYPAAQKTLRASDLQPGDRVKLWIDDQRQVIWGEVTEKTDTRATGTYLGVKGGYSYLSGMQKFNVRSDLIIVGLDDDEVPQPGMRVHVAGINGVLTYMEVQTDVKPERDFKGMVVRSDGLLRVRSNWVSEEFPFDKSTWYVDWDLMQDGPVTDLFPGDEVKVYVNMSDEAMFVERTYCPPFKFEGTIKSRSGRTLVITDKTGTKTVELTNSAVIYKNGFRGGLSDLKPGDVVQVSGESKGEVSLVVCGW